METFDILNDNNQIISQETREKVHSLGLKHAGIMILLINEKNQILIQKRATTKDSHPGKWDISCAGHLSTGEDYIQAALRELKEELNLTIKENDLNYIGEFDIQFTDKFNHKTFIENEHDQVFLVHIRNNANIILQKEEVEDIKWITIKEFIQLINSKESCIPLEIKDLISSIVRKNVKI